MSRQRWSCCPEESLPGSRTFLLYPIIFCILFSAFVFSITTPSFAGSSGWAATYRGGGSDGANSIQQTSDGGYIVAGETDYFGAGKSDIWVLKLNHNGTVDWQKTYGGVDYDTANSIQQTSDGGYVVAGSTGYVIDVTEWTLSTSGGHTWILKLRPDGTIEWQRAYRKGIIEGANSIQQTTDGGFIVSGGACSSDGIHTDFLVLKLRPDGSIDPSCGIIRDPTIRGTDSNAAVLDSDVIVRNSDAKPQRTSATVQDTDVPVNFLCPSTAIE